MTNAGQVKAALAGIAWEPPPTPPAKVPTPGAPVGTASTPTTTAEGGKVTVPANAGRWARYAGKLGSALTVTAAAVAIRKQGYEPNTPDDVDVQLLEEALEEGLRLKFGDADIPWWLGAALAAGGVYAGMRVGAPKLETEAPNAGQPVVELRATLTPDNVGASEPGERFAKISNIFPDPLR